MPFTVIKTNSINNVTFTNSDSRASVRLMTTVALPACTASGAGVGKTLIANVNGALTIDGVLTVSGNRVAINNQVASKDNGIYIVTQVGDGSHPFILTRAADANSSIEVTSGLSFFVEEGTANDNTQWSLATNNPITLDTTALNWSKISAGTLRQELVTTEIITNSDTVLTDTLNFTPISALGVKLFLNGALQTQGAGADYTLSSTAITWLASSGTAADMDTSDILIATYES